MGVIEASNDVPKEPLLTHTELLELQRMIEAGLLARDARVSSAGFADATEQELRLLEDQGALARQRFIEANLGLVGMVSRQFAARCQLPNAELFQEGCLGLPLVNYLPVAPVHEPECHSSIMVCSYSSIVSILSPWMPAMRSRRQVRVSGASMLWRRRCAGPPAAAMDGHDERQFDGLLRQHMLGRVVRLAVGYGCRYSTSDAFHDAARAARIQAELDFLWGSLPVSWAAVTAGQLPTPNGLG